LHADDRALARCLPGSLTTEAGHVIDFMPTLIEMVGAQYPQSSAGQPILPMEGRSLLPILRGDSPKPRALPLG